MLQLPLVHGQHERGGGGVLPVRREAVSRVVPGVRGRAEQQPRPDAMPPAGRETRRALRRGRSELFRSSGQRCRLVCGRDRRARVDRVTARARSASRRPGLARDVRRVGGAVHAGRVTAAAARHPRRAPRVDGAGGEEEQRRVETAAVRAGRRRDRGVERPREPRAVRGDMPEQGAVSSRARRDEGAANERAAAVSTPPRRRRRDAVFVFRRATRRARARLVAVHGTARQARRRRRRARRVRGGTGGDRGEGVRERSQRRRGGGGGRRRRGRGGFGVARRSATKRR